MQLYMNILPGSVFVNGGISVMLREADPPELLEEVIVHRCFTCTGIE